MPLTTLTMLMLTMTKTDHQLLSNRSPQSHRGHHWCHLGIKPDNNDCYHNVIKIIVIIVILIMRMMAFWHIPTMIIMITTIMMIKLTMMIVTKTIMMINDLI